MLITCLLINIFKFINSDSLVIFIVGHLQLVKSCSWSLVIGHVKVLVRCHLLVKHSSWSQIGHRIIGHFWIGHKFVGHTEVGHSIVGTSVGEPILILKGQSNQNYLYWYSSVQKHIQIAMYQFPSEHGKLAFSRVKPKSCILFNRSLFSFSSPFPFCSIAHSYHYLYLSAK
jgi:hypothetical protein